MKRWVILALAGALLAGTWTALAATKAEPAALSQKGADNGKSPGVAAAQALSTITGVAISPLLGVSAVGAWTYFDTPKERRGNLAWYAQPWFWISGLILVSLCFAKDTAGTALPTVLKKPLDIADAVENKVSGLVAVGAFVPLVASVFPSLVSNEQAAVAAPWFMAAINPSGLLNFLLVPIAMISFVIVWLAAHSINILILLSPFTMVDAALKAFRLFLLSLVAGAALLDPMIGAGISLLVIFMAYFIAGWSFRVTALGSIYIWDVLTLRRARTSPKTNEVHGFLTAEINKVPIRTYGRLIRDETGRLVFRYRPWLILPERVLVLPNGDYAVGEGLINSFVVKIEGDDEHEVVTLPPRYRTHEEAVARAYQFVDVREIGFMKGFKAFLGALFGSPAQAARA